jgi:hypothetical protein
MRVPDFQEEQPLHVLEAVEAPTGECAGGNPALPRT